MVEQFVTSDISVLDLLRSQGAMTVAQLASRMQVTQTAVRQRLTRLRAQQYIERTASGGRRGRPSHRYGLTDKGRRKSGSNFADLALVLWEEVRRIEDPRIRSGLLERLAQRLGAMYAERVRGETLDERLQALATLFADRQLVLAVERAGDLPVLVAPTCPYPDLADHDRSVCSMERLLFSQLLQRDVRLSGCRLDGGTCCTFQCSFTPRSSSET